MTRTHGVSCSARIVQLENCVVNFDNPKRSFSPHAKIHQWGPSDTQSWQHHREEKKVLKACSLRGLQIQRPLTYKSRIQTAKGTFYTSYSLNFQSWSARTIRVRIQWTLYSVMGMHVERRSRTVLKPGYVFFTNKNRHGLNMSFLLLSLWVSYYVWITVLALVYVIINGLLKNLGVRRNLRYVCEVGKVFWWCNRRVSNYVCRPASKALNIHFSGDRNCTHVISKGIHNLVLSHRQASSAVRSVSC